MHSRNIAVAEDLGPAFVKASNLKTRRQIGWAYLSDDESLAVTGAPDGLLNCLIVQVRRPHPPFKAHNGAHALAIARAIAAEVAEVA